MKYKIIQTTWKGEVYTQETTSYYSMYGIIIQMVGLDYSYIRKVKVENDIVIIDIQPGKGNAIQTFTGLKKLYVIHVEEMIKQKSEQANKQYESYQNACKELYQFDIELINNIKDTVSKL